MVEKTEFMPVYRWGADDYGPSVTGRSALKLVDSGVAPLVALTRGYRCVDRNDVVAVMKEVGIVGNTSQGKRFKTASMSDGVMLMPWYRWDSVAASAERSSYAPDATAHQFRPVIPEADSTGKERKYEFVRGSETVVGAHPVTPHSWLSANKEKMAERPVLLAEGLLKADSALSAMLLSHYEPQDLAVDHDNDTDSMLRNRLSNLLLQLPAEKQVVILQIAGVGNWRSNGEWLMFPKGLRWWIGIDGDVRTNPAVWKQANEMVSFLRSTRGASEVKLLSPMTEADSKMGIDDYLAEKGPWEELISKHLKDELPEAPARETAPVGTWRVRENGAGCEKLVESVPTSGDMPIKRWVDAHPIGGRLVSTTIRREADVREVESGAMSKRSNAGEVDGCEIELSWRDNMGDMQTAIVTGPSKLLSATPDTWWRQDDVYIPTEVLRHPDFPPRGNDAADWLRAIKDHRSDDHTAVVAWTHMGWVPVTDDEDSGKIPAFIASSGRVICDSEDANGITLHDPSEQVSAERFGTGVHGTLIPEWDDEEYKAARREDLEEVLQMYVGNRPWMIDGITALVLGMAFRPVVPLRAVTTAYLVGPPGSGKSHAAQKILAPWARFPGDWDASLPLASNGTYAAFEVSTSFSYITVIDDLAPQADRRSAEMQETNVSALVRSLFNGIGRARSTKDGGLRRTVTPRCPIVMTAENAPSVSSIRSRTIQIQFEKGVLSPDREPTDALDEFTSSSSAPALVGEAAILYLRERARVERWKTMTARMKDSLSASHREIEEYLLAKGMDKQQCNRSAKLTSDVLLGLTLLYELGQELGIDEKWLDLLDPSGVEEEGNLHHELVDYTVEALSVSRELQQGRALITALYNAMSAKHAHVIDIMAPDTPPSNKRMPNLGSMLGWVMQGDNDVAKGVEIGKYFEDGNGEGYIQFNRQNAFNVAQRHYPSSIPPGQKEASSWKSVYNEGLVPEEYTPEKGRLSHRLTSFEGRPSGVVVSIRTLMDMEGQR